MHRNPWDSLDPDIKVGDKVKGKVVLIADYGAFVEIKPGVEGLIHVSEMSWSPRLRIAQDFLKVGDEVEAQILSLDRENRKMSLGLKQLTANPWENIREKYPVGSEHKAVVRNITNFGVFAELEDGIEGLVHISDLSWDKIKHPSEMVQVGDTIDVVILDFDEANHKLSLGHKQLLPNPWNELESKYPVGTTVEATVGSATDKGANVTLEDGTEGFAFKKDLVKEDGNVAGKHFQATLCRCIGGNGLASELRHHRADVDDLAASLGYHSGNHGFGNDERGVQVNVYHLTEILHGHLGHRDALDYPGIVDQNVYRSQFGLYVGHHLLNLGLVGYVTDISAGFYALGPVVLQGLLQMM